MKHLLFLVLLSLLNGQQILNDYLYSTQSAGFPLSDFQNRIEIKRIYWNQISSDSEDRVLSFIRESNHMNYSQNLNDHFFLFGNVSHHKNNSFYKNKLNGISIKRVDPLFTFQSGLQWDFSPFKLTIELSKERDYSYKTSLSYTTNFNEFGAEFSLRKNPLRFNLSHQLIDDHITIPYSERNTTLFYQGTLFSARAGVSFENTSGSYQSERHSEFKVAGVQAELGFSPNQYLSFRLISQEKRIDLNYFQKNVQFLKLNDLYHASHNFSTEFSSEFWTLGSSLFYETYLFFTDKNYFEPWAINVFDFIEAQKYFFKQLNYESYGAAFYLSYNYVNNAHGLETFIRYEHHHKSEYNGLMKERQYLVYPFVIGYKQSTTDGSAFDGLARLRLTYTYEILSGIEMVAQFQQDIPVQFSHKKKKNVPPKTNTPSVSGGTFINVEIRYSF